MSNDHATMSSQSDENALLVTCRCQLCNGAIEFDANELNGRESAKVECPHCKMETIIFAPRSPLPPVISNEAFIHQLLQLSESERGPLYAKKLEEIRLKAVTRKIHVVEPVVELPSECELLTPKQFPDFIGQNRVKARLDLAIAAAKSKGEALPHVLLVGPAGLGKATLASIVAKAMGAGITKNNGALITKAGDLCGVLTNLEEGDVLFIDEIQLLQRATAEYLHPAMEEFKMDIIIDQGPDARNVRLSLPRFTLVGTTPRPERLSRNLLSLFPIVESLDAYTSEELAAIARQFANGSELKIDESAVARVARTSDGTPMDVLNRLKHVRDFAHVKGERIISPELAEAALKMLVSHGQKQEASENRDAIPSEVRREVWRRDGGKCVRCGSRERLEFDHIIPVTKGGSNTARNIELLCEICNRAKAASIQ
jgi:Holliday junction DNA helicase RuvB subunit